MKSAGEFMASRNRREQFDERLINELLSLYRFAHRLAGAERAEDLVHDACLRAVRAWEEWSGTAPAEFRAWLFRIIRNQHIDDVRRAQRRPSLVLAEGDIAVPVPAPDDAGPALKFALETLTIADVQSTLDGLPADVREIIELRDMQGLSYAAIASILGVPTGTVMSRLHRARRKLRDALLMPLIELRRERRISGGSRE